MLIGQHDEAAAHRLQQLSWPQKEIRIAGPAEGFLAPSERLVEQKTAGRDQGNRGGECRAVQEIDHYDRPKPPIGEGPRSAVLKVPSEAVRQPGDVSINREHRMATSGEETCVAAPTGGQVEHGGGGWHQIGEARDPSGDWRWSLHGIICKV